MLRWLLYLLRVLFYLLGWPLRRLLSGRGPDYVVVTVNPSMPLIPPRRLGLLRRLMSARERQWSAYEIDERLDELAKIPAVRGILVLLRPGTFSAVQAEALHQALLRFRQRGREVVLWTKALDLQRLVIASAASKLTLAPGGSLGPLGMHRELMYVGKALSELGVELDVVHSGPHKSAYDNLTRQAPSEEVKAMLGWLFDAIFDSTVTQIARGRGRSESDVRSWIDAGLLTDERALELGIIDAIAGESATVRAMRDGDGSGRAATFVAMDKTDGLTRGFPERPARAGVAVLRVDGAIVDGTSRRPPLGLPMRGLAARCGDETLVAQARQLAKSRRVKAVVLHIDSPGGSAAASEAMTEALDELAARKPLVAAMGSTAASGGYYVATAARHVVAHRATLTGSIGVIMAKIVNAGLLGRLKVNPYAIKRGARADVFGAGARFDDEERALVTTLMERTYAIFVDRVANARGLSRDVVDGFGRGRVWTGGQAVDRGLVDAVGGLREAADMARKLAELPADAPLLAPTATGTTWLAPAKAKAGDDSDDDQARNGAAAIVDWLGEGLGWLTAGQPLAVSQVLWRLFGK